MTTATQRSESIAYMIFPVAANKTMKAKIVAIVIP
jgi:hypothetical protein